MSLHALETRPRSVDETSPTFKLINMEAERFENDIDDISDVNSSVYGGFIGDDVGCKI